MIIQEGKNSLEIDFLDCVPDRIPGDDVHLSVSVSSEEFAGHGFAWMAGPVLASFLGQLEKLEERRQGEAVLEGLSADEFRLRIWSLNRRGHLAVAGMIAKHVFGGEGKSFRQSVEFGFEFDPTLLPKVLSQFRAIAEATANS